MPSSVRRQTCSDRPAGNRTVIPKTNRLHGPGRACLGLAVVGCLCMASLSAQAGDSNPRVDEPPELEEEIGGLVVDDTITHIGHAFARFFGEYRHSNHPAADYNLTIHERPSARWGSLIWVTHERKTLFRRFVGPRKSALRELAHSAAAQIDSQVSRIILQKLFADNFDLDRDEI